MADREHNSSAMPGMTHNPDVALDRSREHTHEHVHHSTHAVHQDNSTPVYTTGTTDEKVSKLLQPSAQDSHLQHRGAYPPQDVEKSGGLDYEEKGTRSSSDPEAEDVEKKKWYSPSVLYRRYRLPAHILIGALFTG
jgi:CNT family concentrative nucleoside transporter